MQAVVPGLEQEDTGVLLQFTLFPFFELFPVKPDTGVVPRREMINPWQYPPAPGFDEVPGAGIDP
jgi:hypothetical protein